MHTSLIERLTSLAHITPGLTTPPAGITDTRRTCTMSLDTGDTYRVVLQWDETATAWYADDCTQINLQGITSW